MPQPPQDVDPLFEDLVQDRPPETVERARHVVAPLETVARRGGPAYDRSFARRAPPGGRAPCRSWPNGRAGVSCNGCPRR